MSYMIVLVAAIPLLFGVLAGLVFLQIHLSKKQNQWVGLILPVLFFFLFIVEVILIMSKAVIAAGFVVIIALFLSIIPAFIFTAINMMYKRDRKGTEIKKMNIQDL